MSLHLHSKHSQLELSSEVQLMSASMLALMPPVQVTHPSAHLGIHPVLYQGRSPSPDLRQVSSREYLHRITTVSENIIATIKMRNNFRYPLEIVIFPTLRQKYWTFLFSSPFCYRSSNFAIAKVVTLNLFLYKFCRLVHGFFSVLLPIQYCSSNYCDSNSCQERERATTKSDNFRQRAIKKAMN